MASWVCKVDGTVFTVGAPRCPSLECQARDAYEQGGDPDVNVYDVVAEDEVAERLGLVPSTVDVHLPEEGAPVGNIPTQKKRS